MRPVPLTFQRFEASMVSRKTPDGPHHVLARCGLTLEDAALAQIDLLEALP